MMRVLVCLSVFVAGGLVIAVILRKNLNSLTGFFLTLITIIGPSQQADYFLGIVFFVSSSLVLFSFVIVAVIVRRCVRGLVLSAIVWSSSAPC